METKSGAPEKLRVAGHFPMIFDECKEASVPFFFCFTKHAGQLNTQVWRLCNFFAKSKDVPGNRPIVNCLEEMKVYDECMVAALNTRKNRLAQQH